VRMDFTHAGDAFVGLSVTADDADVFRNVVGRLVVCVQVATRLPQEIEIRHRRLRTNSLLFSLIVVTPGRNRYVRRRRADRPRILRTLGVVSSGRRPIMTVSRSLVRGKPLERMSS